jgi:hypothetical protein
MIESRRGPESYVNIDMYSYVWLTIHEFSAVSSAGGSAETVVQLARGKIEYS